MGEVVSMGYNQQKRLQRTVVIEENSVENCNIEKYNKNSQTMLACLMTIHFC